MIIGKGLSALRATPCFGRMESQRCSYVSVSCGQQSQTALSLACYSITDPWELFFSLSVTADERVSERSLLGLSNQAFLPGFRGHKLLSSFICCTRVDWEVLIWKGESQIDVGSLDVCDAPFACLLFTQFFSNPFPHCSAVCLLLHNLGKRMLFSSDWSWQITCLLFRFILPLFLLSN